MTETYFASSTYLDPRRAEAIYGEAFRRSLEYVYACKIPGAVAEFGTFGGFTARIFAQLIREFAEDKECYPDHPPPRLYLYDSFTGFPATSEIDATSYQVEDCGDWSEGSESVPPGTDRKILEYLETILPPESITIVKGYYRDTIVREALPEPAALVHLDCDLYSSTREVLEALLAGGSLQDGSVLLCDDYNCNRARPDQGQRRALRDVFGDPAAGFGLEEFFPYGWHGKAFFVHTI